MSNVVFTLLQLLQALDADCRRGTCSWPIAFLRSMKSPVTNDYVTRSTLSDVFWSCAKFIKQCISGVHIPYFTLICLYQYQYCLYGYNYSGLSCKLIVCRCCEPILKYYSLDQSDPNILTMLEITNIVSELIRHLLSNQMTYPDEILSTRYWLQH